MYKKPIMIIIGLGVSTLAVGCASGTAKVKFTAENNPTTRAGRGAPDASDHRRPSAWVYIDGLEGRFIEREGIPQVEWVIEGSVGPDPTFRVEVFEPLLGTPKDFNCVLYSVDSADGAGGGDGYGIAAEPGTFNVGQEYSLLDPGPDFLIRVPNSDTLLERIEPLRPGVYMLTAGVKNSQLGVETLAVTRFTVGESG